MISYVSAAKSTDILPVSCYTEIEDDGDENTLIISLQAPDKSDIINLKGERETSWQERAARGVRHPLIWFINGGFI